MILTIEPGPLCFTITEAKALDPVTVFIRDTGPSAGSMTIICYGEAWTAYWGAMGGRTVLEFVRTCDADYIANKMRRDGAKKAENNYLLRIVSAVLAAINAEEANHD